MRANSALNVAQNLTQTAGNSLGGFLYRFSGAGGMFLMNGISYLFSGFLSLFLKVRNPPENKKAGSEPLSFWKDLKSGIGYTAKFTGLKDLILMAFILNFFASGSFLLLQPLFLSTPGFGIQRYGIAAGAISAGNLMGMLFTSVFRIPSGKQMTLFLAAAAATRS
nr:MFS transporter [Caproiciproducens sp. NJN-50]